MQRTFKEIAMPTITRDLPNFRAPVPRALLLGATLLAAGCATQNQGSTARDPAEDASLQTLRALRGTYRDPAPYAYGEAFGQRTFTFDRGAWTLEFVLALDPALAQPVFAFRTRGHYTVLGPSPRVADAYEAVFVEDAKYLTLKTDRPELIKAFGFTSCQLTPGVERDISADGCLGWKPVAVCNEDHDLLALTAEGGVRFGVRPRDNDMCDASKRPTELTPAVLPTSGASL
jgi:hypothetical protein